MKYSVTVHQHVLLGNVVDLVSCMDLDGDTALMSIVYLRLDISELAF